MSTINYSIIQSGDVFFTETKSRLIKAFAEGMVLTMTLEKDWADTSVPLGIPFQVIGITREDGSGESFLLDIRLEAGDGVKTYEDVQAPAPFGSRGGVNMESILGRTIRALYRSEKADRVKKHPHARFIEF